MICPLGKRIDGGQPLEMNESNLARAYELFRRLAGDLEPPHGLDPEQLAGRLREVSHRILDALDDGEETAPKDPVDRLQRQSTDIADELRRVERLMRERLGRSGND